MVLGPTSDRHQRELLEELDDPTTIPQILWIFHNKKGDKRITLKDNPHFYLKLPSKGLESEFDSWKDGKGFHRDPLTHIGPDLEQNGTVYVILDRSSSRLYLDVAESRVFGNLWHPRKKIILKDICGVLDSEDNLRPGIEGESLDFWYRTSPNRGGTPAPPGRSFNHHCSDGDRQIKDTRFGNWRTLVHAAVKSQDIDLMIRAKHSSPHLQRTRNGHCFLLRGGPTLCSRDRWNLNTPRKATTSQHLRSPRHPTQARISAPPVSPPTANLLPLQQQLWSTCQLIYRPQFLSLPRPPLATICPRTVPEIQNPMTLTHPIIH
ncbi:hypothetical protein BGW80DRAFT_121903 [Lactifluus volemus]|nr:hypothetical protein BGW80DRAFT_121903 [Lactifluus volemus]